MALEASAQAVTIAAADSLPAMSRGSLGVAAALRYAAYGDVAVVLRRVYGDGAPALLWSRDGTLTTAARATLDALHRIGDRGLDPAALDVAQVESLAVGPLQTASERFVFDAALSAASIRTVWALQGGADARGGGAGGIGDAISATGRDHGIGGRPRALADGSATLSSHPDDLSIALRTLATTTRPDSLFDAAEPPSAQYQRLKHAISTYRTRADADSIARGRLTQILGTLARARRSRITDVASGVVVNIAAYRLHATGADPADTLSTEVVVGAAGSHRTPEMQDSIRYLVFAPYWDVPASITRSELLPIARRDPRVLTMNNYQIVDHRGRIHPATPKSVRALDAGRLRIRQLPGGTNSLGRVKFMFPNSDDIYLHDTPLKKDFGRDRRDLTHGCVRVGDPVALARLLLRDQPEWTAQRIDAAMNGKTPVTVRLSRPMPVHLIYATAVARADGGVDFHHDIYGLDTETGRVPAGGR
jgi:murein L,D-transpeptidase YcbB/YkuD